MSDSVSHAQRVVQAIRSSKKLSGDEEGQAEALAAYYLRLADCDDHPWLNRKMNARETDIDRAVIAEIRARFIIDTVTNRDYQFDHGRLTAADLRHNRQHTQIVGKPKNR